MRKSEWFGGILKEDQPGETAGERLSRKIGLFRSYRGKVFILPLGIKLSNMISQLFERNFPRSSSIVIPFDGDALDLGAMLAGEVSSYRQLPVWFRLEGTCSGVETSPTTLSSGASWSRGYMLVDAQQKIEIANDWTMAVRRILEEVGITDYVELIGYANREWVLPHPNGTDAFLACNNCSWKGLGEFHPIHEKEVDHEPELGSSPEKIETPGVTTIEDLSSFLKVDDLHILKTVLLESEHGLVIQVLIRGDLIVSIPKVEKLLGDDGLKPASPHTLERAGAVAGYAGPSGSDVFRPDRIVMDQSIRTNVNYVAGANQVGFHLKYVRLERDFNPGFKGDIAAAVEGDCCGFCGSTLKSARSFRLASWTARRNLFSISGSGPERLAVGIGFGTLHIIPILFSLAERGHHEGILHWPDGLEPFLVYLLSVRQDEAAEEIYTGLSESGISVFYDNRSVSPGVKFKDADLMGCPIRLTVSGRSMEAGGIEVFRVDTSTREILTFEEISRELVSRREGYVNSA